MTPRAKSMLMMFADYGICLLLQIFGMFILSLIGSFSWGYPVYSALLCLVVFIFHYVRTHKAGRRQDARKNRFEGLILAAPLALLHLLLIVGYVLFSSGILPGDLVLKTVYSFPDNAPRVTANVILMDYITLIIRLWFSPLVGFMQEKISALVLLIMPFITCLAGFLGYLAGQKKFYFSEHFSVFTKKLADKFNE